MKELNNDNQSQLRGIGIKALIPKVVKYAFLSASILFLFVFLLSSPVINEPNGYQLTSSDLFLWRLKNAIFVGLVIVLPALIVSFDALRRYVPLYKKKKILLSLVAWLILFTIGVTQYGIVDSFQSEGYKSAGNQNSDQQAVESAQTAVLEETSEAAETETAQIEETTAKVTESVYIDNNTVGPYVLTYGEVGVFGKNQTIDGEEYIHYYLPAGKYEAVSTVENAMFFIEKAEMVKNSSGFMESVNVSTHKFAYTGEKIEVEIKSDERVFLVINSVVEFRPK